MSLANLLGLRLFAAVLDPSTGYFLDRPRTVATYLGTLTPILGLMSAGIALALVYRRVTGHAKRAVEVIFFAGAAAAIHGTHATVEDLLTSESAKYATGLVTAGAAVLVLVTALAPAALRFRFRRGAETVLLVLSPFVAITSGQVLMGAWRAYNGDEARTYAERTPAAMQQERGGPRVVVLVMDELDQFLAFDDRAAGLAMPVFDALVATSFHGTRARAPAMLTERALPSLLTGRKVVETAAAGASDRLLVFDDGSTARFSDTDTMFRSATAAGKNVALAGFYHPYCRILGDDVASCSSRSYRPETQGLDFTAVFFRQSSALIESFAHGRKVRRLFGTDRMVTGATQRWHIETWKTVDARATEIVADPRFDLVFVHYPLPHPPGIWDPKGERLIEEGRGTYDGNLALADKGLGRLLEKIDGSPRGAETTVIVLADHGKRVKAKAWLPSPRLRPGESRPVPFVVRAPRGAGSGVSYAAPFETMVVHDLVSELLDGRLGTSEAVRAWIDDRATGPLAATHP